LFDFTPKVDRFVPEYRGINFRFFLSKPLPVLSDLASLSADQMPYRFQAKREQL
jgi:hypothetical protein